ncbi:MAG: NifU family protein [Candidatus Lokiarchaeota archaeon]|nr:NifU family protein [Candidatus Lokiarchaeota archaeon]
MAVTTEEVEKVLDKIRPSLQADGGGIELINVTGNKVVVRLMGACHGCAHAAMTLKHGVERYLKQELGNDISVESVV